jgi:hypothetical protein
MTNINDDYGQDNHKNEPADDDQHEDSAIQDAPDRAGADLGYNNAHADTGPSNIRSAGHRMLHSSTMSHDEWLAARRQEIARRSNEYYKQRASMVARQNRRNLRITMFVCAVAALAMLGIATPIALQAYAPDYLDGFLANNQKTETASTTSSGSIYMSPSPSGSDEDNQIQVTVPVEPPAASEVAPAPALALASSSATSDVKPEDQQPAEPVQALPEPPQPENLIEPAGVAMTTVDAGLLHEAATRPEAVDVDLLPVPSAPDEQASASPADREPIPETPAEPEKVASLDPMPEQQIAAPAPTSLKRADPAIGAAEARELLERGDRLMKLGDIVSARALYSRALESDQANAALRLGSTFDPLIYRRIGVLGMKPDPAKALEWYMTAAEAGNANARRAYDALKNASAD